MKTTGSRNGTHQLEPLPEGGVTCVVCGRSWKRGPGTGCPGVWVYDWGTAPDHLKTLRQLKRAGLKLAEGQQPQGCVIGKAIYYLYDEREAVPRPPATPAQLAALEKARQARTCADCGLFVRHKRDLRNGLCGTCAHQKMIENARAEAIVWAREVLADPGAVILDTETTGLGNDAEIIEIAVIDTYGEALLNTLVKPRGPIPPEASAVHGITAETVAHVLPWSAIHDRVGGLLQGASRVVTYNAYFDRRMLRQTRALYGLPAFEIESDGRLECAMQRYAEYVGQWSYRRSSFRWWPLNGGHRALGDCRAALDNVKRMAAADLEEDT